MTIASEITRINNNIQAAYTAANNKGATIPAAQNSANLANCINSIETGGNSEEYIILTNYSNTLQTPVDNVINDVFVFEGTSRVGGRYAPEFNVVSTTALRIKNWRLKPNTNYAICNNDPSNTVFEIVNSNTDILRNYTATGMQGGSNF